MSLSCLAFPGRFEHGYSRRSFQISTAGWYDIDPHSDTKRIKFFITECLRRAGEILPDRTAIEEINDNKFGQLMRNKTVQLLSLFLMLYMGVEVTIGGRIFLLYMIITNLTVIRVDCSIFNGHS